MTSDDEKIRCKAAFVLPLMIFLKKTRLRFIGIRESFEGKECVIEIVDGIDRVKSLRDKMSQKQYEYALRMFGKVWWKIPKYDYPRACNAILNSDTSSAEIVLVKTQICVFDDSTPGISRCIMPTFRYEACVCIPKDLQPKQKKRKRDKNDSNDDIEISPFVKSMQSGVSIPANFDYKKAYGKYLTEKYL